MSLTSGSLIKCVGSNFHFLDDKVDNSWIDSEVVEHADDLSYGDNGTCVFVLN